MASLAASRQSDLAEAGKLTARVASLVASRENDLAEASNLKTQIAALRQDLADLREHAFSIEQLLVHGAAARPPGAVSAVAALGQPAVSVIMPTYKRPAFVGEAIASIQAQSFQHWELVVVSDGGLPDAAAAVRPFLADPRIRFIEKPQGGATAARNAGLAVTNAPLIAYLDDDNLWYPDFLACAVDLLATQTDVDMVYGALVTELHRNAQSNLLWRKFDREALERGNFVDTSTIVHRRSLVGRLGGWDEHERVQALGDYDLVLRYTAEKPAVRLRALAAYYRDVDGERLSVVADPVESRRYLVEKGVLAK